MLYPIPLCDTQTHTQTCQTSIVLYPIPLCDTQTHTQTCQTSTVLSPIPLCDIHIHRDMSDYYTHTRTCQTSIVLSPIPLCDTYRHVRLVLCCHPYLSVTQTQTDMSDYYCVVPRTSLWHTQTHTQTCQTSTVLSPIPVSYTHLTLPTIYSV